MITYHFLFRLPKPPTYYMTINGVASPSAKGALSAPRTWSKIWSPKDAPDEAETVRIDFKKGLPTKITNINDNTVVTDSLDLFLYCNMIAGKHGVGRIDIVGNRFVGIKSRGVYENPGGTLLREAYLDLEGIWIDREVKRIPEGVASEFASLCYNGFCFDLDMDLIRNSIDHSHRDV